MSMLQASTLGLAPSSASIMRRVILATLPGLLAMTFYFGLGVLTNVALAAGVAMLAEAAILALRRRRVVATLTDGSALLTGVLLGASLPPGSPWWLLAVGAIAAVVVAKQLYGGLGHNPFNPAMVGYALLLVSFPTYMTLWPVPHQAGSMATLWAQVSGTLSAAELDALSGATPLDAFKHKGLTEADEFWAAAALEDTIQAWRMIALAWLAGGLLLLFKRVISWHIPVAMLGSMALIAALLYGLDSDHYASPLFHLTMGAALFGAFFIATDPVSAATSRRGKLLFGIGIGVLVMIIRTFGGYPDAVAFAVLLMNLCVPLLDLYSAPVPTGHRPTERRPTGHRPPARRP